MSTLTKREPIRARSAWKPSDFPAPAAYSFTLTEAHLAAFDAAIAVNRRAGQSVEDLTARNFSLPSIAADVASWREEACRRHSRKT